jgi:hypothetical protein
MRGMRRMGGTMLAAAALSACATMGERRDPAAPPVREAAEWVEVDAIAAGKLFVQSRPFDAAERGTFLVWTRLDRTVPLNREHPYVNANYLDGKRTPEKTALYLWQVDCGDRRARRLRTDSFSPTGAYLRTDRGAAQWTHAAFEANDTNPALHAACERAAESPAANTAAAR